MFQLHQNLVLRLYTFFVTCLVNFSILRLEYKFLQFFKCNLVVCAVCACVRVRTRACVCKSIHPEGCICLDQLEYQGTDQRRCVVSAKTLHRYFRSCLLPLPSPFIATLE